jgi:hypothetical protein
MVLRKKCFLLLVRIDEKVRVTEHLPLLLAQPHFEEVSVAQEYVLAALWNEATSC